jgi:hypothetical protein
MTNQTGRPISLAIECYNKIQIIIMEPATKLMASINLKERFNSVLFSDMGKLII